MDELRVTDLVAIAENHRMSSELTIDIYQYLTTWRPLAANYYFFRTLEIWRIFRNRLPDDISKSDFESFLAGKASLDLSIAGLRPLLGFDEEAITGALSEMRHLEIENSPQHRVRVSLSELFDLGSMAGAWSSRISKRDAKIGSLIAKSSRAIPAFRDARTQSDREKVVHWHGKIIHELQQLGAPNETMQRVHANDERVRSLLRNYEGRDGPLAGVVGHLLSGDRASAKTLLVDDVIGRDIDDETIEILLDGLRERPAWGMKLSQLDFQKWLSTSASSVDRIRRHSQQWIDAGEVWLDAADWPVGQRRRAAEFLVRTVASWLDPQAPTSVEVSETSLDRLLVAAHEILPRCNLIELSARPQAVSIGGVKVVSWTREGSMFAWVAFSEGSVAISVDLDRFTVTKLEDNAPATTAAALATAWLLDSLMRVSGTTNTLFSSSDEIWLEGPTGTEQGTGHSQALLAALDEHHVRAHLRTLPDGYNPSKEALARAPEFLRAIMGPNQTYVRAGSRHSDGFFDSVVKFSKNGSFLADVIFEGKYHA